MADVQKFALAFSLTVIINGLLELGIRNCIWKQII